MAGSRPAGSALSLLAASVSSRADLSPMGRAIAGLVREWSDRDAAAGDRELSDLLWWTITLVENEQNWQSPSTGHSVWPSGGYNNLGGSYRRYSLGGGTAATFPEYGERRLLFSGGTGFLSAVKAALLPYHRDRRPVLVLMGEGCRAGLRSFTSRIASRSPLITVKPFLKRQADARPESGEVVLVTPDAGDLTHVPLELLRSFDRILAECAMGSRPPETVCALPNTTLCYTSPEILGYGLDIVVPQSDLHRAMVLRQQRGGAITEEALKLLSFLLGGAGALGTLSHAREEALLPPDGRAARPSLYLSRSQEQLRHRTARWRPALGEACSPADRYVQRLAAIVAEHARRRVAGRAATIRGAREAEASLRAHVSYLGFCDVLTSRESAPAFLARRVREIENRQAGYHRLPLLSRNPGFPASETIVSNCGMAACAAAIEYLALDRKSERPVLFGRQCYNENEWLVRDHFPGDRVVLFEVDDLAGLVEDVRRLEPLAVVLEIVSNSTELAAAPLDLLMKELSRHPPRRTLHLLVDIAAAGIGVQLERILAWGLPPKVVLLLVESLQKFYQHGLELTSGGALHVLASRRKAARDIRRSICHLRSASRSGLDPLSAAKLSLTTCDRRSLQEKSRLHARNTRRLAEHLERLRSPFVRSVCRTGPDALCQAPYFWIIPAEHTYDRANSLLCCILDRARSHSVNIQNRDSFFFNNTVLHISRDHYQGLRIASGTESAAEMAAIETVFEEALQATSEIGRRRAS